MISNYFKLALRILVRKKFFTFITLFGISFTLMILMLFASYIETELGANAPLSKKDKMVLLQSLTLKKEYFDTIPKIDSVQLDGAYKYDTTYQYESAGQSMSRSSYSLDLLNKYADNLDNVEYRTFMSLGNSYDEYVNNGKVSIDVGYVDHQYWKAFDHQFIEGRAFDETAFKNGEQVLVVTEKLARDYFGDDKNIVDREITFDSRNYKIIGMIKTPSSSFRPIIKDVYAPHTTRDNGLVRRSMADYFGNFSAVYVGKTPSSKKSIMDQLTFREGTVPHPTEQDYNIVEFKPLTYDESYARGILYDENPAKSKKIVWSILIGLFSLFILLPTLNLINLNVSRIMERSAEIGVRKSFGAGKMDIVLQFIFENIVQTIIGGILGFGLALIAIKLINDSQILEDVTLMMNMKFFSMCLLLTLFFGLLSGLLPAYRMSKIHIVNALKSNKL